MTKTIRIDVIIPTIGAAPYLEDAVASVVAQTHGDWRLVVSADEARPGPAPARLAPFLRDRRVEFRLTEGQENAAYHKSRLVGGSRAAYVAILDDDDRWDPEFLERRVQFLERHRECAFVFSRSRVIDASGRLLALNQPGLEEGVHEGKDLMRHVLKAGNVITSSSVLVRRRAYESVGSEYHAGFVVGYDLEMWTRLLGRWPAGYLNIADLDYRLHPGQSTAGPVDCEERVRLLDHLEQLLGRTMPDVPFGRHFPVRRRALVLLGAALDAAERGDVEGARAHVRRAGRMHAVALAHPAAVAALAATALGPPGRVALRRTRSFVRSMPRPLESYEKAKALGHSGRRLQIGPFGSGST